MIFHHVLCHGSYHSSHDPADTFWSHAPSRLLRDNITGEESQLVGRLAGRNSIIFLKLRDGGAKFRNELPPCFLFGFGADFENMAAQNIETDLWYKVEFLDQFFLRLAWMIAFNCKGCGENGNAQAQP
jgi:hypothetical protein